MRVLAMGASGFTGSAVVAGLWDAGQRRSPGRCSPGNPARPGLLDDLTHGVFFRGAQR